jgi:hypothetical protein
MKPKVFKTLKDQLVSVQPELDVIHQTGGPMALAVTALHSVLMQLLHDAAGEPSPKTTLIEGKPLDVVNTEAPAPATLAPATEPAPAASPEVAIPAAAKPAAAKRTRSRRKKA